ADLALYYVYNPAEQHPWYYALPEYLTRLQIAIGAFHGCAFLFKRYAGLGFAACLVEFAIFAWQRDVDYVQGSNQLLARIETERMALGGWIKQHSQPDDTLFAGHGHIAREAGLYTIDYSGLNSRIATDYRLDQRRMIADLRPTWIAQHGVLGEDLQATSGYELQQSFYAIATIGLPVWRVYRRSDAPAHTISMAASPAMLQTDKQISHNANGLLTITGNQISVTNLPGQRQYSELILG